MLMTIRPEKLASYIFYHHQLQEEDPGCGAQHAVIAMHENLLFHYMENPENENCLVAKGSLNTHNTPRSLGRADGAALRSVAGYRSAYPVAQGSYDRFPYRDHHPLSV